jgi:histidyl-tRNA synthetase
MGMQIILVIGPDEAVAGTVTVKDLKNGNQETVLRSAAGKLIRKILEITPG